MDEFESGFYDKKKLEELKNAQKELLDALLDTGLGHLVVWCVENLDRLLTQRAADSAETSGNLLALLEECYENGNAGQEQLYAWFSDQVDIIEQAIEDARQDTPSR